MTRHIARICSFVITALLTCTGAGAQGPKARAIGEQVPNSNSLRDLRGNRRSLHDLKGHKAIVLVFLGTDCPVSNLHAPGIIELEKSYRGKKVQVLGIYSNESNDLEQIAGHATDRDFPFPVLKDSRQHLADTVGVRRVPTVAVLDGEFTLRYRGRVSDQYGVSSKRPKATRADLAEALDEILAGRKVTVTETGT
jgi:peroxiredoxin